MFKIEVSNNEEMRLQKRIARANSWKCFSAAPEKFDL